MSKIITRQIIFTNEAYEDNSLNVFDFSEKTISEMREFFVYLIKNSKNYKDIKYTLCFSSMADVSLKKQNLIINLLENTYNDFDIIFSPTTVVSDKLLSLCKVINKEEKYDDEFILTMKNYAEMGNKGFILFLRIMPVFKQLTIKSKEILKEIV